ncbi:MAG TPA: hypothetical protein VK737_01965 [Opitutales bacterium]|jgi:hypothetical protein|nr:hypothetical protein [Opitutales bacterium]
MPDFEFFSESEWEDRGELAWNEFDWQQYLKQNEQEIARFLALYLEHRHKPDRLDEVARHMGWGEQEWAPGDAAAKLDDKAPSASMPFATPDSGADATADEEDGEEVIKPYTIHKHPVFIATRGLNQHLSHVWEHFIANGKDMGVNPSLAWKFASSLHVGELNSVMAIHALDFGDFTLTICHLKNALSAVNHSLSLLHAMPLGNNRAHGQFFRDVQSALFDLREIWLRVMSDCRVEYNHGASDDPDERE